MLEAKFVTVTKELVEGLLAKNVHNRRVKPHSVGYLANQIRGGNWLANNQGVAVSSDGILIDGQHRLMALREAGYPPVKLLLVTGLEPGAISTIDVGTRRDHADTMKLLMNQDISTKIVQALTTLANFRFTGNLWGKLPQEQRCSTTELIPYLLAYEAAIAEMSRWFVWGSVRAEVRAAFIVFFAYDPFKAKRFIEQVTTGENIDRTMPSYWLREQCLHRATGQGIDLACAVRCINEVVRGRMMRMWKFTMAEDWCPQIKDRMPHVDTR